MSDDWGEPPGDAFASIHGQDRAVRALRDVVARERIASAYLFEGPSGVGKEKAALALARAVIGEGAWHRIQSGAHPDVRVYRPRETGHRNIKVEFLREEVLKHAEYAPFEAKASFLIFPEADVSFPENHPEAGNALLKTLEEPKPGVTFILLAERPRRLLPTIRSRAQPLRFNRLERKVVEKVLADAGVDETTGVIAAALAGGRADKALFLAEEGRAEALLELAERVDEVTGDHRPDALVDVADELAKQDDLRAALEGLAAFYADLARAALGLPDEALAFRHKASRIRHRGERLGARRASARVELINGVFEDLDANANKGAAMDALLFRLRVAS